jgi:anti-sigma regulatory factor (Ser/Thr protein kinase)
MITPAHTEQPHVIARSHPLTLGAIRTSPQTARMAVKAQLAQWHWADLADICQQIVSELVTNAVVRSEAEATPIAVRMVLTTGAVFIEVYDRAPGVPVVTEADADAESGRGLFLVAALASDWGWSPTQTGKMVWAAIKA